MEGPSQLATIMPFVPPVIINYQKSIEI